METPRSTGFDWAFYLYWLVTTTLGWVLGGFFFPGMAILASGMAIGVLQWLPLENRLHHAAPWIPATISGWTIGWFLLPLTSPTQIPFLTGLIIGLSCGIAQWLVLRKEMELSGWWIMISVVGWTTGMALMPGFFTSGMIPGAITGLALELLLRYSKK